MRSESLNPCNSNLSQQATSILCLCASAKTGFVCVWCVCCRDFHWLWTGDLYFPFFSTENLLILFGFKSATCRTSIITVVSLIFPQIFPEIFSIYFRYLSPRQYFQGTLRGLANEISKSIIKYSAYSIFITIIQTVCIIFVWILSLHTILGIF